MKQDTPFGKVFVGIVQKWLTNSGGIICFAGETMSEKEHWNRLENLIPLNNALAVTFSSHPKVINLNS